MFDEPTSDSLESLTVQSICYSWIRVSQAVWLSRNTNKIQLVREFIIPKFIEGSTCFERHTAHHQELQTLFAASGLYTHMVTGRCQGWVEKITQPWQRPATTWVYKTEAANTVWSSWWWAVCRWKHVEPSINFGIINSITSCILLVFLLSVQSSPLNSLWLWLYDYDYMTITMTIWL